MPEPPNDQKAPDPLARRRIAVCVALLVLLAVVVALIVSGVLWSRPARRTGGGAARSNGSGGAGAGGVDAEMRRSNAPFDQAPVANVPEGKSPDPPSQPPVEPVTQVYFNDFERRAGPEWSEQTLSTTPNKKRKFLGEFGAGTVSFTLHRLPPHRLLRLTFDLLMLRPVDGSSKIWGPDLWDLGVAGGPRLLHTTFCNCGFFTDNNEQAYPDEFPCGPHPGWTGCSEKQTLGYTASWGGPERTFGVDSVYQMVLAFPHTEGDVVLRFTSFSAETLEGESWGLDNFRVETLRDVEPLPREEAGRLWEQLADGDPVRANAARWALIAAPEQAAALFAEKLKDTAPDATAVCALLRKAEPVSSEESQQALRELRALGSVIDGLLRQELPQVKTGSFQKALRAILDDARDLNQAEPLRRARAIHALHVIASPASRALLEKLYALDPSGFLPKDALPPGTDF